jgi:diguanylate cyclase (GGDEF)-like protein
MTNNTGNYWKTISLLILLYSFSCYILFVTVLSKEMNDLRLTPPSDAYTLITEQTLSNAEEYLIDFLLLDHVTKSDNHLVLKVSENNNTWLVTPLKLVLFHAILAVFYPIMALSIVAICSYFIIANYQRRVLRKTLRHLCDVTDEIAGMFGQEKLPLQSYSRLSNLSFALDNLAKYATQYKMVTEQSAFCDKLTQLTNRHTFLEHIEEQLSLNKGAEKSGLLFIDLDGFKQVNDSFGHSFGDEILIQVAERLKSIVRSGRLNFSQSNVGIEKNLARLGGDEFTIFIQHIEHSESAIDIAKHVLTELERDFVLGNKLIKISASIGIALYPESADKPNALVQLADVAMYRAKKDGRGIYRIYSPEMGSQLKRYHYLLEEMRLAIASNNFYLTFQPIIHAEGCVISYFEALARWQHPIEGMISPMEFIPIAEESNQILPLGDWILDEACRQMFAWHSAGMTQTKISVNVSVIQLRHRPLYKWVMDTLARTGLPPTSLMLEITESCFLDISEEIIVELEKLRQAGIFIAIDDFGTGFSSLAILATLPVDVIKIDRMFINEATTSIKYKKILKSIVDMSFQLDLKVVAEGIEDIIQFELLKSLGVEYIQGFLISPPESSINIGNKVLKQGIGHLAHNGAGVWKPKTSSIMSHSN